MLINQDWKIESDDLSVTLYQRKDRVPTEKDDRTEYWQSISYHGSIQAALRDYVKKQVFKTKLESVEIVLQKLDEVQKEIENLFIIKKQNEVEKMCEEVIN